MINLLQKLWSKWKAFALIFGTFMSNVILTVLFFTVILPYGVLVHFFGDPLAIKSIPQKTGWRPYPKIETSSKSFENQF